MCVLFCCCGHVGLILDRTALWKMGGRMPAVPLSHPFIECFDLVTIIREVTISPSRETTKGITVRR